jgi:methylglutaconyl-CoA hydratase
MTVRYETARGVATITLASPETRNVLTPETMGALVEHLASAASDDTVRVVVLTGEGSTFCAGADLAGASLGDAGSFVGSGPRAMATVLEAMLDHPLPIVARVQGHVAGGGNGLVAAADLAVAVESAKFAFSEVRVGVAPAVISVVCLARMLPSHARELLLTGERVSARRVREAGLLTAVVSADALDGAVAAYVDQLLLGGPQALARTKELLRRVPLMQRDDAFAWTAQLSSELFASDEAREGMSAFLERRSPPWAPEPPPST